MRTQRVINCQLTFWFSFTLNGSTLTLTNATSGDSGAYVCMVKSRSTELNITHNLVVLNSLFKQPDVDILSVEQGHSLELFCADIFDRPISWFHNERFLSTSPNLILVDVQRSSAGHYSCRTSTGRPVRADFTVKVNAKPLIAIERHFKTERVGNFLEVECTLKSGSDHGREHDLNAVNWFDHQAMDVVGSHGSPRVQKSARGHLISARLTFDPFDKKLEGK